MSERKGWTTAIGVIAAMLATAGPASAEPPAAKKVASKKAPAKRPAKKVRKPAKKTAAKPAPAPTIVYVPAPPPPPQIDVIRAFEVGLNNAGASDNYDVVLVSEFDDEDALQRYIEHPVHQEVVAFVRANTVGRAGVDILF